MNCYHHPNRPAVAQCPDCGKGLCTECAAAYSTPICKSCNGKRINTEKRPDEKVPELERKGLVIRVKRDLLASGRK